MKENITKYRVQYHDTDAYGVVWHGSYLRWMEEGRVNFLFDHGIEIHKLQDEKNIVMPVVEIDIKYKMSARLMDRVILRTNVEEITKASITFVQEISLEETGKVCTLARVKAVALKDGKLMRNLDELFKQRV